MSNGKNIFLTGITGFLGSFLAVELLKKGHKIYALARGKGNKSAKERVYDALKFAFYEDEWDVESVSENVEVVEGDIIQPGLGMSRTKRDELAKVIDVIFHSAALTELNVPIEMIRKPNVEGTRHVLDFAMECKEKGRLQKFHHISTIYVCGDHEGEFDEDMLDVGQNFNNSYEQSKFEAEILIHEYIKRGLNVAIYRPSLIMGDSKTGKTNNFRLFYQPLKHFIKGFFQIYPADPDAFQNLINVDTVASIIVSIMDAPKIITVHTFSSKNLKVSSFVKLACSCFKCNSPQLEPSKDVDFKKLSFVQQALCTPFIPYFNQKLVFICSRSSKLILDLGMAYPDIDEENLKKIFYFFIRSSAWSGV